MVASLFMFVSAHAFAGSVAPVADPATQVQSLAALWPMIGLALANLFAYGTRKLSAEYTFFHTGAGAFVLSLLGAVITSLTPIFQSGTVTTVALAWAAVGGATSFLATLNPSSTSDDPPVKSPNAKP